MFLENTPAQAESLLQAAKDIRLPVNTDETEFICFNQDGAISSLNRKPLKLVDQFIYIGSNISSIKNYVNIRTDKVWIVIDRLMII